MRRPVARAALLLALAAGAPPLAAAQSPGGRESLDTVLRSASGTPDGEGLLPTALAEAWVALEQARLAAQATEDLAAVQEHARGVLHALDPALVATGPGAGYGVRRAVADLTGELRRLTASSDEADAVHLMPAAAATGHLPAWIDALAVVAERITRARSAAEALAETDALVRLARQLTFGRPAATARMATEEGEAGLAGIRVHLGTVAAHRAARLAGEAGR